MGLYDTLEWSDDYPHVVAAIGPRYRVIVARNGLGWNFQQRRSNTGRWHNKGLFYQHRDNLAACAFPMMHSGYVKDKGITPAFVAKALEHLPERFSPQPTYHQLVINTPEPRRPAPSNSTTTSSSWPFGPVREPANRPGSRPAPPTTG